MIQQDEKPKRNFDQLHAEHHGIRQQIRLMQDLLEQIHEWNLQEWLGEFMPLLVEFQETLVRHFHYEEQGGFMAPVLEVSPAKESAVKLLQEEHVQFLGQITTFHELLERARSGSFSMEPFCEEFNLFISAIHHHERSENELLQEVFSVDIGAGD